MSAIFSDIVFSCFFFGFVLLFCFLIWGNDGIFPLCSTNTLRWICRASGIQVMDIEKTSENDGNTDVHIEWNAS